jgi:hypothetical protein
MGGMKKLRRYKVMLAIPLLCVGLVALASGAYLETRNPRSNHEDDTALAILAIGACVTGFAIALPLTHPVVAALIGLACPIVGFGLLVVSVWSYIILRALTH